MTVKISAKFHAVGATTATAIIFVKIGKSLNLIPAKSAMGANC